MSARESGFRLSWYQLKLEGVDTVVNCSFIQQIFIGRRRVPGTGGGGCPGGQKQLLLTHCSVPGAAARAVAADPALPARPLPRRPAWGCPVPSAQPSQPPRRGTRPRGTSLRGWHPGGEGEEK